MKIYIFLIVIEVPRTKGKLLCSFKTEVQGLIVEYVDYPRSWKVTVTTRHSVQWFATTGLLALVDQAYWFIVSLNIGI